MFFIVEYPPEDGLKGRNV